MKQPFDIPLNEDFAYSNDMNIDSRILQVCAKAEADYLLSSRKQNPSIDITSSNKYINQNINNKKEQQQQQQHQVYKSTNINAFPKQIKDNTNILINSTNINNSSKTYRTPNFKLYQNANVTHPPKTSSLQHKLPPHKTHISSKHPPDLNRSLLQAKTLMKKYKFNSALQLLHSCIQLGIYHSDLFYLYGEVNRILKQFQIAEDYLLLALNFEMHSPYVFYSLGLLYQELSQFKYSNSFFKLFLQLLDKSDVHFQMAKNYSQIGKYVKSAEHLTKAIEMNKECVEYYRFRAEIYRVIGLTELACDDERMVDIVLNSHQKNYG